MLERDELVEDGNYNLHFSKRGDTDYSVIGRYDGVLQTFGRVRRVVVRQGFIGSEAVHKTWTAFPPNMIFRPIRGFKTRGDAARHLAENYHG